MLRTSLTGTNRSGGSCSVSFAVRGTVAGVQSNQTSGATTDQNAVAGPPSNTANLTVTASLLPTLASQAVRNDFDGDGISDLAIYRADLGGWEVKFSLDGEIHFIQVVEPPNDNDKDEYVGVAADLAVWRNNDGWHIQRSNNLTELALYVGQAGDVPVIGDFDGDGAMDVAAFNGGHWWMRDAATGMLSAAQFGQAGDTPFAADFDGDGKDDVTVVRQAEGIAYARRSIDQEDQRMALGSLQPGELVVFGDYDGDGKAEVAIWRTPKAAWEVLFRQTLR